MQSRFCSLFSQLLQLFPPACRQTRRVEFQRAVNETGAERRAKGFTCWQQSVALLFCQLGRAQSLREICGGLASCEGRLLHLGVKSAPKRSTLSYANEHRPWEPYQRVFYQLLSQCQSVGLGRSNPGRSKKFQLHNRLLSLDASVLDLCASLYDWAKYQRTKGAVKLHLILDHDVELREFQAICRASRW